jgi:ABC-2 type transport system ATP-binding protein
MVHAVEVEGVTKRFRSGSDTITALDGVSLTVRKGEIFGLLGPNGAGKTTLISLLVGLTTPDEGVVRVCGMDVEKELAQVQQSINMVRGFGGALEKITTLELMRYYAMLYGVDDARVEELLKLVDLWDRRNQYVSLFSSGWRQRFFIAKALLNRPKVLLMDEPTVGLDVDMAISVRTLVRKLNAEGYSILLTTHYMKEAEELCDRIALIAHGKIVAQGTPRKLKSLVKQEEAINIRGSLTPPLRRKLERTSGVLAVSASAQGARLLVKDASVMGDVLKSLGGQQLLSVSVEEPSLEDVFLRLTKEGLGGDEDE